MPGTKKSYWILGIIFISFFLRIWGINHNFPDVNRYFYETEEYPSLQIAMGFGTGDLNPHSFNKPSLYFYLLYGFYGLFYILGRSLGFFIGVSDFVRLFFYNTWVFYLIGRMCSLILGVGSIYILYLTGKRFFNVKSALLASFMLAITPIHIEFSQLAVSDMLGLLLAMVSVYYFLSTYIDFRMRNVILGSFFAGLALSAKYYYGFVILSLFVVIILHLIKEKSFKLVHLKMLLSGIILFLIGFVIATPFAVLDYKYFFSSILELESVKSASGALLREKGLTYNWWIEHIFQLADNNIMGIAMLTVSVLGVIYGIIRREWKDIILLSIIIFFYSFFSLSRWNWSWVDYLFLIIPYTLLLGSNFLLELFIEFKLRRVLASILLLIVLLPPLVTDCINGNRNSHRDTKYIARKWIEGNIPRGSGILMDKSYVPQLSLTDGSLKRITDIRLANQNKLLPSYRSIDSKNKYVYLREESLTQQGIPYDIYIINSAKILDIPQYKQIYQIEFVILNSQAQNIYLNIPPFNINRSNMLRFYGSVQKHCTLIKVFKPNRFNLPGPEIQIYKVN